MTTMMTIYVYIMMVMMRMIYKVVVAKVINNDLKCEEGGFRVVVMTGAQ